MEHILWSVTLPEDWLFFFFFFFKRQVVNDDTHFLQQVKTKYLED